jgi:hypothetical protein
MCVCVCVCVTLCVCVCVCVCVRVAVGAGEYTATYAGRKSLVQKLKGLKASPPVLALADRRYTTAVGPTGMFKKGRMPMQRTGQMIIHDWHVWWTCGVGKFQMSPPVMQPGPFRVVCDLADCIGGLVSARVSRAGVAALREKVARQQPTAVMSLKSPCTMQC